MNKELNFSSNSLYKKKFKSAGNGYDPDEVDEVLDQIIEDYRKIESSSSIDVKALINENEELKKVNASLLQELTKLKERIKYLPKDKPIHIDNYELLQRIGKLESYIKEHIGSILKELNKWAEGKFEITANDVEFRETEDEIIE